MGPCAKFKAVGNDEKFMWTADSNAPCQVSFKTPNWLDWYWTCDVGWDWVRCTCNSLGPNSAVFMKARIIYKELLDHYRAFNTLAHLHMHAHRLLVDEAQNTSWTGELISAVHKTSSLQSYNWEHIVLFRMHPDSRREMTFQFLCRLFVMLPPLPAGIINQGLPLGDLHSGPFNLQRLLSNETVPFRDSEESRRWATASHHLLQVTADVWPPRELLTCRLGKPRLVSGVSAPGVMYFYWGLLLSSLSNVLPLPLSKDVVPQEWCLSWGHSTSCCLQMRP